MIVERRLGRALRVPALHLNASSARCAKYGSYTKVCPMSLDVQPMVARGQLSSNECLNCGVCVDNCQNQAIVFGFGPERQSTDGPPTSQNAGAGE